MTGEDGFLKEAWNRESSGTCVIGAQKWEVTEERELRGSGGGEGNGQRPSTTMLMHGDATTQPIPCIFPLPK